jgi:hypothetical protein
VRLVFTIPGNRQGQDEGSGEVVQVKLYLLPVETHRQLRYSVKSF